MLGSACPEIPPREVTVRLVLNGEARTAPAASGDPPARLVAAARVLAAVEERLEAGDWVITGSTVQTPVQAGDEIAAECTCLRRARVSIAGA